MTQDGASEMPAPGVGHWEGERLEVGRRYMYRPEFIPLLTEYLGARPGTRILDVGCGSGFLTRLLARALEGVQIVGLDADEELIAQARRELQREDLDDRVEVVCGDAYQLPFADESFDMVTSHTVLCIMSDPAAGLREQIRVIRKGGVVSAVVCFCHTDGLPHYHGRYPLPGDHRIDELNYRLWQVWRRTVRPQLLQVDHSIVNQDLVWGFRDEGLGDIQVNGHLMLAAPGDDRIPAEAGADYALSMHRQNLERLLLWRREHGEELAAAGFGDAEFEELLDLKRARMAYLQEEPSRVKEVMEVFTDPLIVIRGTRRN